MGGGGGVKYCKNNKVVPYLYGTGTRVSGKKDPNIPGRENKYKYHF
jgi:hypothetical protein